MVATQKSLSFDEAVNMLYVAVIRGRKKVILKVKKVITRFLGGQQKRVIILSDGSHYTDDKSFMMWEVKKA